MSEPPDALGTGLRALLAGLLGRKPPRPNARTQRLRIDYIEGDLREVRTRVNALFFTVIAVALGDLVARLVAS
ncbi:MAG: hypothetical protein V3S31_00860 [Dehalococcoidia bacterium]